MPFFAPSARLYLTCTFPDLSQHRNLQSTDLGSAQARIQQGEDDGLIALACGSPHREFAAVGGVGLLAELAHFEECFNFCLGERLDGCLFELGNWHGLDRVGQVELMVHPSEESGETDVEIVDGLRG